MNLQQTVTIYFPPKNFKRGEGLGRIYLPSNPIPHPSRH
jgi:hypothetical protein